MADSGDGERCFFARGGPVYVPGLVSPVTSVLDFKFSVVRELQGLEAEVTATGDFEDELNVDELKIFTEEELVEKALKEDLEDYEDNTRLVDSGQCSYEKTDDSFKIPESKNCTVENTADETRELDPARSLDDCSISSEVAREQLVERKTKLKKKGKKRGRFFDRNSRAAQLGGDYFGKVEQLAELKKKQEEDKAAARLHSFNGSIQLTEGNVATAEKIERLQTLRFITSPLKARSLPAKNMPITNPEVVLCVEIYSSRVTSTKTQEFLVLGRQLLTELRDSIYCLTDQLMQEAGQHDPSGYFLIEDWFLNDLRDPLAIDYSKPILDWLCDSKVEAEQKWARILSGELQKKQKDLLGNTMKTNLPNLKSTDMHKTRFCDLRFRLGAGYLYCHQGDCKHTIVIRDMRLIHPEDDQNMVAYPIHTFQIKLRTRKCSVCSMCAATKVTVDDKWAKNNPCYFCDSCYYLFHYNEDGTLLYNEFTVYDYRHE